MTLINAWIGGVTSNSARVIAKTSAVASVRLAVATDPALTSPVFTEAVAPDAQGVVSLLAVELSPDTRYWWALELDSVTDTTFPGQVRTHPLVGQPATFTFGVSSCAGGGEVPGIGTVLRPNELSNATIFSTLKQRAAEEGWLWFTHLGDMHYYDLGSGEDGLAGDVATYRRAYDDVLLQPNQHELYRNVALAYAWDDHDYGPNNSDGTLGTKANAAQVYRERVPNYGLPDSVGAVYQSWQVGRVQFVMLDTRFYRSPNADPDGPDKTMLGAEQKTWLEGVLSTSAADVLVVFSSVRWMNGSGDSWPGFATERQQIGDLFSSTGWSDRMVMINADVHANAFDSGANNQWGGFPVYVVSPLDGTAFSVGNVYDIGTSVANHQYGRFTVTDTGNTISITSDAVLESTTTFSHTAVFDVSDGEEPPQDPQQPGPATVAVAKVRTRLTWLACHLASGDLIAELPNLQGKSVSRVIGRKTDSSVTLPIPAIGGEGLDDSDRAHLARSYTAPARTMLVVVVNDIPTWAGIPLPRDQGTPADIPIGLTSLEGYLDNRFVGNHTWRNVDESVIVAGLLGDADTKVLPDGTIGQGINLVLDIPATGTRRDRTYLATDHKTVYETLVELMGVQNGPEWTIDLDWTDTTHTGISKIFRLRKRLGSSGAPPVFSSSVFSSDGESDATYLVREDYGGENYANVVQAYSSGQGEDQPVSDLVVDYDAILTGAPIWEKHFQPSTSIILKSTLDAHAEAELARVRNGSTTYQINARSNAYPRFGVHWRMGDDVAWELQGHAHPDGLIGHGRAIGFELSIEAGTIKPILQEEL